MRSLKQLFYLFVICCFHGHSLSAHDQDSIALYDASAEEYFFNGDIPAAIHAYQRALTIYWQYKDSTYLEHINEHIRLVERLTVTLRETGNCSLAIPCLKTCLRPSSDRALIAKVIHEIIRCDQQTLVIDTLFKNKLLQFFKLEKIDPSAHTQLNDLLSGAKPEEEELINFFVVLEKGFVPAVAALEQQEQAQRNFVILSFFSFSSILLACVLGFILYILKKEKDHIQREKIALLQGKEKETDRLSIDLHDILGYKIVELKDHTSKLYLTEVLASTTIARIAQGLDELHESMRYIVQSNLTPESLKFGLAPALETLINRVNNLGVLQFKLYKYGLTQRLAPTLEKHTFYIIQELVNNIIKHSKGKVASFEITQSQKEITIIADDDGIGYQPSVDTLKTVKARTHFLKGTVVEDSQIEHGTTIIITIPIGSF